METIILYWGYIRLIEKKNGNYHIVCWGYAGFMEKKMETTIMGFREIVGGPSDRSQISHRDGRPKPPRMPCEPPNVGLTLHGCQNQFQA